MFKSRLVSLLNGFKASQSDRPASATVAPLNAPEAAEDTAAYESEPVRIQVLSDLHLEITRYYPLRPAASKATDGDEKPPPYDYDFPVSAEILALLGDIGLTKDERLFGWLRVQLRRFKIVFFPSGNHEAYHSSLEESSQRLAAFARECDKLASRPATEEGSQAPCGRFVLLDRTRHDLSPTLTVLGCTLWSRLAREHVDAIHLSLNDFRMIARFTPQAYQAQHARDAAWLAKSIKRIQREEPHRRIVVMTHHAPTVEDTSDPKFVGGQMNSAFATELTREEWWRATSPEQGGLKVWMFGHTHWPCDFERRGVRVVSNPRGYRSAGEDGYDPGFVVEA